MLTFLAGAELNPETMKSKIKEVSIAGLVGFFTPFIGCSLLAYFVLNQGLCNIKNMMKYFICFNKHFSIEIIFTGVFYPNSFYTR
jgi:Kef-type K+ transport system membrane component KefB